MVVNTPAPHTKREDARAPDFRVVQAGTDKNGKTQFTSVGGIWKQEKSKSGNEFSILKIGGLKLLVFKNEPKPK